MVTPDELFGPASPHWSDSKMADRRRSGEQGRRPKTRAQNSRLHASRRSSNDVETNTFPDASDGYSSPERKTYDEGTSKNHEPKTPRRKSSVNHGESPLRSVSRFESISRHEAGYDSSRTSDSNSRDDDKPIPTSRRHSRTGDTPATNRLYGSNTARIERDNHRLYDARTDKRYVPRYSPLSNRSSYNHGDIVDENLMISNPKLDITLLKLFAQSNSRSSSNNTFLPSVADGQEDFISMEPVMWRVHPMDAVHRETLDREMAYITDNINPRDVVGELYRQHVLTHTDYNQLSRIENQGDRAVSRLMVKTLQRRGAGAYPAFLEVLQARGYPDVRERLLESEQSLKVGIRADKHGLKNYLMTPPRTRDRSTERTNDYTGLPMYPTLSSNPTVPATPLMMTAGQITPLFHNPYPYQMPMTFQMASPTYPMMANQGTNFGGGRTPTPLDQIQFNQIERNLDYMRDELRALHEEMRDIKSNIKKGEC
ncbi:uncharacterized protein LOC131952078 [Physella acuta]|uniref:uncharacterized protein LOC131952078 n=1 Tax=Physella acuta TaxID=109671 RepID=UPI0027DB6792|nr:uncharacterized protein LOC131952078 [Physella acuta]